jgi:hypothetical protein
MGLLKRLFGREPKQEMESKPEPVSIIPKPKSKPEPDWYYEEVDFDCSAYESREFMIANHRDTCDDHSFLITRTFIRTDLRSGEQQKVVIQSRFTDYGYYIDDCGRLQQLMPMWGLLPDWGKDQPDIELWRIFVVDDEVIREHYRRLAAEEDYKNRRNELREAWRELNRESEINNKVDMSEVYKEVESGL